MKASNVSISRPSNTRERGFKGSYNIKEHDPKHQNSTTFKRPRIIRRIHNQVLLTSTGLRDATVYHMRVAITKGNLMDYYMTRTYHLEYDVNAGGTIMVYDSKKLPCTKKGVSLWEVTKSTKLNF